jgi:hypothetical protein
VAAVHRHEVEVHVDRQIALGDAAIHLDQLAVRRVPEDDHAVRIAAVVVVEAIRPVLAPHLLADHPLDLGIGHPAVEAERDDDVNVVDAVVGEHLAHDLEHELPDIGRAHDRQRHRDVIDRDRDLHPRRQHRVQRIGVLGMVQRVADRRARVRHAGHRPFRVDDTRPDREILDQEVLAVEHDPRCGVGVDRDDVLARVSSSLGPDRAHVSPFPSELRDVAS